MNKYIMGENILSIYWWYYGCVPEVQKKLDCWYRRQGDDGTSSWLPIWAPNLYVVCYTHPEFHILLRGMPSSRSMSFYSDCRDEFGEEDDRLCLLCTNTGSEMCMSLRQDCSPEFWMESGSAQKTSLNCTISVDPQRYSNDDSSKNT